MVIDKTQNGEQNILALQGRLDTNTAGQLEADLNTVFAEGANNIILDFTALEYISSAGLRIILSAQKRINAKNGKMVVKNINETIMEVFEMTGFVDILTIE